MCSFLIKIILPIFALVLLICLYINFNKIHKYRIISNYYVNYNNNTYVVTRKFKWRNKEYFLAVDTSTFNTIKIQKDKTTKSDIPLEQQKLVNNILNTPPISDYSSKNNKNNIYLTVDLCQSSKPGFEEDFFKSLISYGKEHNKVINVAISLTARWIMKHKKEFNMLKRWNVNKDLIITWVNHTYNHFYNSSLPDNSNFMIHDIENSYDEVVNNEIYMLNNGVTPSVFFRFPGLVYNDKLLEQLKYFNLVTINSDAWLAKIHAQSSDSSSIKLDKWISNHENTLFKSGSIILVHGNKNEHLGISIFLKLLKQGHFNNYNFASLSSILLDMKSNYIKSSN